MKRKILFPILVLGFELVCLTGEARPFGRRAPVDPATKPRTYGERIESAGAGSGNKYLALTLRKALPKEGAQVEVFNLTRNGTPMKNRWQSKPELFNTLEQEIRLGRPPYVWIRSQSNDLTEGILISSDVTNGLESQLLVIPKEAIEHMAESTTLQELALDKIVISLKLSDVHKITVSTPGF